MSRTAPLTCLCRTATTFVPDGSLDEEVFTAFLQRFVDAGLGVYLASAGSGESHAMTRDEIRRVYQIGVAVGKGKGKVQVNANPPEQHTARMAREQTLLAIECGVDVVNVYGPTSWHGFKPNDQEYRAYYADVLTGIHHPIAITPNPVIGYTPTPAAIADICRQYGQVTAVNLSGVGIDYFIELKDRLPRADIEVYAPFPYSFNMLQLGATGMVSMEGNILPKTFRRYLDCYASGQYEEMARLYADINRFICATRRWHSSTPRWLKMFMRVFKLPGGADGLREPYRMPDDTEQARFTEAMLGLGIAEIDAMARAAGLSADKV